MSSSPRRKRYNTLSPSFEKEFRFVKDVVVSIKHQTKKYLGTEMAFTEDECLKCATFIQETCSQLNFVANEILTYNEFVELILKNHRQRILCIQTDSYHVLNKIQKWQQQFQLDINQCYDRLLLCLNDHVYIVSDRDPWRDLPGSNLEGVADFDQKMKAFRADISSKMDALKERPSQNNEGTPEPLQKQVEGFGSYKNSARETCTLLHSVCDATLEWMREEGRYPEVLWQQITSNNSVKEDLVRQLSELRQKRSQLVGALGKKRKVREQMERTFAFQNKERRKMKNNREMIEFVILNLEQKLESKNENKTENTTKNSSQEKHQKGEDVKRKINERSKRSSNNHCNESGYHLRQLQVMRNQYTRIRKEQRILYISNYELKVFISQKNHQLQELQRQVDEVDVLINNVSNELTKLNVQMETLRKMRDDRLSPGVFKKITSQNNKGPKNKANVEDACCFVSKHIGRHWKKLYENLPFNPARSASRRTTDIELWDKMSLTQDRTDEELAGRSLAKWRVINRPCSVGQLVWALRKIDQQELAEKVKKKFWTSNKGNNNNNNNNGNNNNNNGNNNNGNNNNGNNNNNNNNNGNNNNTAANNNNSKTNNNNTISTNSNNTTTTNNSCTTKNNNNSNTTTTTTDNNTTTTINVNSNTTTAITTNNNSNSTTDSNTTTDNNIGNTTNNNSNTTTAITTTNNSNSTTDSNTTTDNIGNTTNDNSNTTTTATTNKNINTTTTNNNNNATTDNNTATTTNDNSNTTTNNSNTTNNKNSSNTTTTTNENSKINSNDSLENAST